jgi:hypothetical protein
LADALIRPLLDSEIPLANQWAIQEGWNPGLDDARIFNAIDPGSLMALEVGGKPIGAISAVWLNDDYGFAGFFVLSPEHRRARYGWMLLQAGLARMQDRVIGSETIFDLVRTYARYGMRPHYTTTSYHGTAPHFAPAWHPGVEPADPANPGELLAYDIESCGLDRGRFLRAWLTLPRSRVLVFRRAGKLCGIGVARQCHRGVRIGPLQADDPVAAQALFDALSGLAPGESLSIDCSEPNPDARRLAMAKGLVPDSSTTRLYRGTPPAGRLQRVYGLISYSLG